jgi:hypothetical protein
MKKRLNRLIASGRIRQNMQSLWIHSVSKNVKQQGILFQENLNFNLGLFLTKNADNIKEAKEGLYRLLHYFVKTSGQFPLYLTDFPRCQDRLSAAKALQAFLKIYENFSEVLGASLKDQLIRTMDSSYSATLKMYLSENLRGRSLLLSLFVMYEFERLFNIQDGYGTKGFLKHRFTFDEFSKTRDSIAEVYGMVTNLPHSLLKDLKPDLYHFYKQACHEKLGYMGPIVDEGFSSGFLIPSLFEALTTDLPSDCMDVFLYYPIAWETPTIEKAMFHSKKSKDYAYSFFDQAYTDTRIAKSRACPFYLAWKEKESLNSLSLKAPRSNITVKEEIEHSLFVELDMDEPFVGGKRQKGEEITIYITKLPGLDLHFSGVKASCFHLGETLHIVSDKLKVNLTFSVLSGEGTWMGHIALGDRSQPGGLRKVECAPDWKIFLRTIRRSPKVKIGLKMELSFF